jgi:hypothetical protein
MFDASLKSNFYPFFNMLHALPPLNTALLNPLAFISHSITPSTQNLEEERF